MQINYSSVFDRVNHQRILYKLCSVGIGGSVLSILTQFLSNRSQQFVVNGCQNWLTLYQECRLAVFLAVIGPPVHIGPFFNSGGQSDRLSDDSTLLSIVPSVGFRVSSRVPEPRPLQG